MIMRHRSDAYGRACMRVATSVTLDTAALGKVYSAQTSAGLSRFQTLIGYVVPS